MSDKSYSDSGASDSTDTAHEAKANERVKLIPVSVKHRGFRNPKNLESIKPTASGSQMVSKPRPSTTSKPCEDSSNASSEGQNLFDNPYESSNVKNLFGKRDKRKRRRYNLTSVKDPDAGYRSLAGDTTESEYSSGDSDGESEHSGDKTSCTSLQDGHGEKRTRENDSEYMSVDGNDEGASAEKQNRVITHFWPLRADWTEMKAQEYIDCKTSGVKFEYEPAAYRWDDGEAPIDREELKEAQITTLERVDRLPGLDLPSSVMNFENEGYDFENPFHSPFFSDSKSGGFGGFTDD